MKLGTKIIIGMFVFLLLGSIVYGAKTDKEKLDNVDKKVDKMEKMLEEIGYSTNKPTLYVHGTEYTPFQRAKVWVQLLNESGDDVENGACQVDIYTPDNDELIENGAMTNMQHDGIYYYDLIVPIAQGVYPVIAKCYYDVTETREYADAFTLIEGTVDDKTYLVTDEIDGQEHKIKQDSDEMDLYYTFESVSCKDTNELLLSGLSFEVNAKHTDAPTNDDLIMYWYNYSSSAWVEMPNRLLEGNNRQTVSNFVESNNITRDGIADSNGDIRFRFNDALDNEGSNKKTEFDMVNVVCAEFTNPVWTEVKGSSEMHVSSDRLWSLEVLSGTITNETWTGTFVYNATLSSGTSRTEEDVEIIIDLPTPFPCHHVLNLTVDGVAQIYYGEFPENPDTKGCSLEWEQDLDKGVNYHVSVTSESYFKEIEREWVTGNRVQYDLISTACNVYQQSNGLPSYTIPQTLPLIEVDNFYDACETYLDTFYHWNYTYFNEFQTPEGTFDKEQMEGLDEMWLHLLDVNNRLYRIAQELTNIMSLNGAYSTWILNNTLPPSLNYFTWLANISSNAEIYQQTSDISLGITNVSVDTSGIVNDVWNYDNRTVSSFEFDVVNETEITESVWSYTGTIAGNILLQIATDVWNAVTRTLTSFTFDLVDEELVADNVWNNTARYTHGEVLS